MMWLASPLAKDYWRRDSQQFEPWSVSAPKNPLQGLYVPFPGNGGNRSFRHLRTDCMDGEAVNLPFPSVLAGRWTYQHLRNHCIVVFPILGSMCNPFSSFPTLMDVLPLFQLHRQSITMFLKPMRNQPPSGNESKWYRKGERDCHSP